MKLTITLLGPMHVLELAGKLGLSPQQSAASQELMHSHTTEVRALCEQLAGAERDLDSAFKDKRLADSDVEGLTAKIGVLQAGIQDVHIKTHLAQSALLTPEQIAQYFMLRG
jgi:Spy/CpxP family protein refolding chaperone